MALKGVKVVEVAGLVPSTFCSMILADFGAEVVRVDRKVGGTLADTFGRGKGSVSLDLKSEVGRTTLLSMARKSDVFLEGFRPGVMERLGCGPSQVMETNPRCVYARLTGWGQEGPMSRTAGHDINYLALSGVLSILRKSPGEGRPQPPWNLLGDFAGGAMTCAMGIVMALLEREKSGKGQVIDAAMMDGAGYIASWYWRLQSVAPKMAPLYHTSLSATPQGSHYYNVYECKCGGYMAVGSVEPQFYALALKGLGLDQREDLPNQNDLSQWGKMRELFGARFMEKTKEEWTAIFSQPDLVDACVSPILTPIEAGKHEHNVARNSFQFNKDSPASSPAPAPAPRLSRTPGEVGAEVVGGNLSEAQILREFGLSEEEVGKLCGKSSKL